MQGRSSAGPTRAFFIKRVTIRAEIVTTSDIPNHLGEGSLLAFLHYRSAEI